MDGHGPAMAGIESLGSRYSESYSASLPDFVKLAETFGMTGLRASEIGELDDVITTMLNPAGRLSPVSVSKRKKIVSR